MPNSLVSETSDGELLQHLSALVRSAGARLRAFLADGEALELKAKAPRDFVTAADRASESILLPGLRTLLPDALIVSEEGTGEWTGRGVEVLVDPLDGTTNFAHRHPYYSISVGLTVEGTPHLGVVYAPHSDELFAALRDHGATLNGAPISVSSVSRVTDALLCAGISARLATTETPAFARAWSQAHAVRHDGSAALDLAYVATGRYDAFWEAELRPWDTAAGVILVREAGGTVGGFEDRPFDIRQGSIVASNGLIGDSLLSLIG